MVPSLVSIVVAFEESCSLDLVAFVLHLETAFHLCWVMDVDVDVDVDVA